MPMIEKFIKNSHTNLTGNRPIPNWFLFTSFLAFVIPLLQEQIDPYHFDWIWFLYIIPATVMSYYLKSSLKALGVAVLSGVILCLEYYHHLYLRQGTLENEFTIAFGVILSMIIASVAVAHLAEKIEIARKSWKLISETTDVGIEIVDKLGYVVYANQAFTKLMKIPQQDIIGNYCRNTEYQNDLRKTLESEKGLFGKEYCEVNAPAEEKFLLGDTFVLRGQGNKVIGAILTLRDITEKKMIEAKVRQSEKFKVLGQMAAGLAHEIRNPLTSIRGFLQLNYLKGKDPSEKDFIQIMLEEIDRVSKLLSEFLILAKQVPPRKELYSLKVLITKVTTLIGSEATLRDIKVRINVAELIPLISIDPEQIKQVFLNLAQNAMEAMPKGGSLGIDVWNQGGQVKICITDTGEGIASCILDKIFNPFYTTKESGTGLGLSLCQRIVENHAGKCEIESEVGVGTKVTITLPVVKIA